MDIMVSLGPASWDEDIISALVRLGVNAFRFPFAKETPNNHVAWCRIIRSVATRENKKVLLFADLPGGKPRLNNQAAIEITNTRQYSVRTQHDADELDWDFVLEPSLSSNEYPTGTAIIGDGEYKFHVEETGRGWIRGRFNRPGVLERRQGFQVEQNSRFACFTDQDRQFARVVHHQFDGVALSFVSDSHQIVQAKEWFLSELFWTPTVIAKIESGSALNDIEGIAFESDGILISRGDLGVDIGLDRLWDAQKTIVQACRKVSRSVIIGTGVLQSMRDAPVPSRAECIDVAAALELGIDGFMFSAETAIGKWPILVVETLIAICNGNHRRSVRN